jgi:hypothetical protein
MEPGERQAGLLDVGAGNVALEAARAGQQIDGEADRLGPCVEQAANRDGRGDRNLLLEEHLPLV